LLPNPSASPAPAVDLPLAAALPEGDILEQPALMDQALAAAQPNLLAFTCNYSYPYQTNMQILGAACQKFAGMGCCAATSITMFQQNPVSALSGTADPTIFPPCMVRYFQRGNCGATGNVDMQNYCINGSIASTTVFTGTLFMPKFPVPPPVLPFPNIYDKTSVMQLMGAITGALSQPTYFPGFTAWPYLFNVKSPLQVQIVDYTYYDGKNTPDWHVCVTAISVGWAVSALTRC
jgi:hypothetical protein